MFLDDCVTEGTMVVVSNVSIFIKGTNMKCDGWSLRRERLTAVVLMWAVMLGSCLWEHWHADDIVLLAPTPSAMRKLLQI